VSSSNIEKFSTGDTILKQGEMGNSAYIVENGTVEILIEKERGLVQSLGTRGKGSIIGEMAIVDNKPRTATIKALEDCELIKISREDFNARLESTDPVIQMIMQVILARYRDMITRAHILGHSKEIPTPEDLERGLVNKTNAVSEIKLINDLKRALSNDEFVLHYQPIIDLKNNKISGFEALIRWNHPTKGLIYPNDFISSAEDSGLITEISKWAVKKGCETLKNLQKTSAQDKLFISINFSAKDFQISDFKTHIASTLEKYDLTPNHIHIEITERLLIDQPNEAKAVLKDCQNSGMIISIDDFGTGYSSLSYLNYFPINVLKIDRSFIMDMKDNLSARNLVHSIITLGHNMDMSIIAEGIEEEEHIEMLKNMGCDKAQGYHFSRPLPENQIIELLLKNGSNKGLNT